MTKPTDEPYITYVIDTQGLPFSEIESMSAGVRVLPFAGLGVIRPIAWLLVLFGLSCSVECVSASCGDYLHPSPGHFGMNHADGPARHDANGIPQHSQSGEPDSSIPVCSGPFCRQSAPVPLQRSEPDFRDPSSKDSWNCLNQPVLVDHHGVSLDRQSSISLSELHLGRIDRPPQVA